MVLRLAQSHAPERIFHPDAKKAKLRIHALLAIAAIIAVVAVGAVHAPVAQLAFSA